VRILYIASAIQAGGQSGGWTHVAEVACGLRALGNDVLVVARASKGDATLPCDVPAEWTRLPQQLAFVGTPQMARVARRFQPDVIIERYYNFAGAGALVAHRRGIPLLLEVNAPMIDPPNSAKTRIDALLLGAMRRWATRQARWSSAIVTPLSSTVPRGISRRKIHELPWGANIEMFNPGLRHARREEMAAHKASL
jgi:starch synthase